MTAPRRPLRPGDPDYHDPTAGFMGAPAARSAYGLRIALAGFGLLFCGVMAGVAFASGVTALGVVLVVLAVVAAADLLVVSRRIAARRSSGARTGP